MTQRVETPPYNKWDVEDDDDETMSAEELCVPEDIEDEDQHSQSEDPEKRYAQRSPLDLPNARAQKDDGKTKGIQTAPSGKPVTKPTQQPPRKPDPEKYAKPKTENK